MNTKLNRALFFDVETTGLPPKGADYRNDCNLFPYIVSIAWGFRYGSIHHYVIKPDGWEIPAEAESIHGISTYTALEHGRPFLAVIDEFIEDCKNADIIIGHNIFFDTSLIKANIYRAGLKNFCDTIVERALHKSKRLDTMMKTIKFVSAKFPDGRGGKFPTLSELYAKCFDGGTFYAHNAYEDVNALMSCVDELILQGIVELPEPAIIECREARELIDYWATYAVDKDIRYIPYDIALDAIRLVESSK